VTLTFDLLTLKVVSESGVTWASSKGGSRVGERGGGEVEAPQAPRGWGLARGVPLPTGEGAVPPPEKFF